MPDVPLGEDPLPALAPDSPELADLAGSWRSAYVHIPFCRRRCPYCDFAVVTPEEAPEAGMTTRYVDAVVAEIAMEPPWRMLDAVNFGGGTPSAIPAGQLGRILDALRNRFGLAAGAEISLEANPEDWSEELGAAWAELGVTRLSWGAQSFDPSVLAWLGRNHTPEEAVAAITGSRKLGFRSVSVDLIFGAAEEQPDRWRHSLARTLELDPHHLSTYSLTVERGTELSRAVAAGAPAPDPDDQADRYEMAVELATAAGLVHYEVSNFALPGHPCRYNLATWAQGEYLAFGLGAHGHRAGVRRRNIRRLAAYLEAVESGNRPEAGTETVQGWAAENERVLLGLRRRAGVAMGVGGRALLASDEGRRLVAAGVLAVDADRLRVAQPLLTDAVSVAVLSLSPRDC